MPQSTQAQEIGTIEAMGSAMFSRFLLPFEVTSLLLLVAIIGAVVLAKRRS
jgi:NADH-quinone oxidoreductase subunit J